MKYVASSNENDMILEFLKGELLSDRFNKDLIEVLSYLNIEKKIIENGNINNKNENILRKKIMSFYRGYPNKDIFNNFPEIERWDFVKFEKEDLEKIYYINYDYWNELSSGTSMPMIAAKNIKNGVEIYNVSNNPYINGLKSLDFKKFSPIILITCNEKKFLIIEGHSRMTIYAMKPENFVGTFGFVGYCTAENMKKYDPRMI